MSASYFFAISFPLFADTFASTVLLDLTLWLLVVESLFILGLDTPIVMLRFLFFMRSYPVF